MELSEAFARIVRRRYVLLAFCMLTLAVVGVLMSNTKAEPFTGSVRLTASSVEPRSTVEADAIASRIRAIATSRSVLTVAIRSAHLRLDPAEVVKHVSVSPLGISAVLELTVSETSQAGAITLANALASAVVDVANSAVTRDIPRALAAIDGQIKTLIRTAAVLQEQFSASTAPLSAGAAELKFSLAAAQSQIDSLSAERGRLAALSNSQEVTQILDSASVTRHSVALRAVQAGILGALVGLVLGLGTAATLETLRPTRVGGERIAAALHTHFLGRVETPATGQAHNDYDAVLDALRLVTKSVAAETAVLMPVGVAHGDVVLLAAAFESNQARLNHSKINLRAPGPLERVTQGGASGTPYPMDFANPWRSSQSNSVGNSARDIAALEMNGSLHIRVLHHGSELPPLGAAAILVTGKTVPESELEPAKSLASLAGWPIAGTIEMNSSRRRNATRVVQGKSSAVQAKAARG